jgi:hypothetical protein
MSNKPLMSDPVVEERAVAPAAPLPGRPFEFVSDFRPAGDQPTAIKELTEGLLRRERDLLTGLDAADQKRLAALLRDLVAPFESDG